MAAGREYQADRGSAFIGPVDKADDVTPKSYTFYGKIEP